eukprot:CAMPEP_0184324680 /NCGR_PEP_ID=MMETSP1049-20130417/136413_1 /TAXON_ID=77928 /ORGANISM="Proteomonas sulcata, Strain CCMP704" /LENGTH=95 /DNA_ID=CAMNT_0026646515 /DNA_START=272 /DNA_END=559 /DNA_ORIENTATION=-
MGKDTRVDAYGVRQPLAQRISKSGSPKPLSLLRLCLLRLDAWYLSPGKWPVRPDPMLLPSFMCLLIHQLSHLGPQVLAFSLDLRLLGLDLWLLKA